MTLGLQVATWVLWALPALFLFAALTTPPPVSWVLTATFAFVVVSYVSVWLFWRPTRFEIDAKTLRIVWPLQARAIDLSDVERARVVTSNEFRKQYGYGMRIGAGGLWGGFGLLRTQTVTFSMWISRTDELVIVDLRGARPLLVTPELPERFVQALGSSQRAP